MINKTFVYSKEIAKKNGIIKERNLKIIISFIIFLALMLIIINSKSFNTIVLLSPLLVVFETLYVAITFANQNTDKLIAYVRYDNGRIFRIMSVDYLDGSGATGRTIGTALGGTTGGTIGQLYGSMNELERMKQNIQYMQNPDYVANIIETASTNAQIVVLEILKVHSIKKYKNKVKINCDFMNLWNNKIKYRKNMTIKNCYVDYEELVRELYSKN